MAGRHAPTGLAAQPDTRILLHTTTRCQIGQTLRSSGGCGCRSPRCGSWGSPCQLQRVPLWFILEFPGRVAPFLPGAQCVNRPVLAAAPLTGGRVAAEPATGL
jgi:hypothetical protein